MSHYSLFDNLQVDETWCEEFGGYGGEDGDEVRRVGRLDSGGEDLAHRVERRLDNELAVKRQSGAVECVNGTKAAAERAHLRHGWGFGERCESMEPRCAGAQSCSACRGGERMSRMSRPENMERPRRDDSSGQWAWRGS